MDVVLFRVGVIVVVVNLTMMKIVIIIMTILTAEMRPTTETVGTETSTTVAQFELRVWASTP